MSTEVEICQIRGQVSRDSHYQTKLRQKDICDSEGDWQKSKRHYVQITHGLTLGQEMEKPLREEKSKNLQSRNRNSNTPENWEEFILLIWVTKNTKTSWKMQGESWRPRRQLQCHVKEPFLKHMHTGNRCFKNKKAKASEAKTRFSCITEAHESTRQRTESVTQRNHEEHIAGKGHNSVLHCNLVHKFFRCGKRRRFQMQRLQWTGMEKNLRQFQHGMWEKSSAKRRSWKRHRRTTIKFTLLHW